jgi:cephalosporin hydroxylase
VDRSPISSLPETFLEGIQRGTLQYTWKDTPCYKNPFDLALYAMLLWRQRPGTLIEIGTHSGGSALWFADQTQALGLQTTIISIDVNPFTDFSDPRISFRGGDARQLQDVLSDAEMRALPRPLLVVEDASHDYEVSLASLRFFDRWMHAGEYVCVEDGIVDSFGVQERHRGGPNRAIAQFLAESAGRYEIDAGYCDYFGFNVTWNTNGYLKRLA